MLTKLVWNQICVTPIVFTLTLITALTVRAAEVPELLEPATTTDATTDATQLSSDLSSEPIAVFLPNAEAQIAVENVAITPAPIFQTWTDQVIVDEWYASNLVISEMNETTTEIDNEVSNSNVIAEQALDTNSEIVGILFKDNFYSAAAINFLPLSYTEIMQLPDATWHVAQVPVEPEAEQSEPESTREATAASPSPRWRFTFQPYGFVPLSVEGSATVRDFTSDINLDLEDILSPLNFAAAGRFEAWRGNLGFIFDGAYFNVGQDSSTSRSGLDCLDCIFPSEIDTETTVQYGQFDLGVGYRFAATNPATAATEFDLGPLVVDAIVGMRIYAIQAEIDISTNLDTSRELEQSKTIFEPLVSGRIRWNLSPTTAGWVRGDIAGFGIQGMTFSASFTSGLEWMFSGNTSLLFAYRISTIQYTSDDDLELDLLLHGPYLGMVFRF